jgi:UDP-N-acetylglucosamine transferase subunit ALG13
MNVFFTAGTQFLFPRLDQVVSRVASEKPNWNIYYQAGPGFFYENLNVRARRGGELLANDFFTPEVFKNLFENADLIVTHAGMGNIITCIEKEKKFLMLPRLKKLGEHRNDHQVDSAEAIAKIYNFPVFYSSESLISVIVDEEFKCLEVVGASGEVSKRRSELKVNLNLVLSRLVGG